ncbi:alpha/beta hydrolase [Ideonella sp. B508-1]|uniref:RBBP9/YdeN family alpha/beta hydrolase n=1 Tax=Ideonella sp. B508-1 TaxID=137716 RepID=UPI00034CFE53|nr:alpha/beta hydrolase [Ideonella sp. B508-1]
MSSSSMRLIIVPGLHGSEPLHWQSWLEQRHPGAQRLSVQDWHAPVLDEWADALDRTIRQAPGSDWLLVAHSFGCLTAARWASRHATTRVRAALLVAPANPARFQIAPERLADRLPFPATVVTSRNDPWFDSGEATQLAQRWGASTWDAGHVGHVNVASGHGPWPLAEALLEALQTTAAQARRPCPTPLSRPVSSAWVASA